MKKKNIIISFALALIITGTLGETANATTNGWKQSNAGWCYYQNNSLKTGWVQNGGTWYYLNSSGVMQTGWLNNGGTWYYLDSSGAMLSNTTVGGYVLGSSGAWTGASGDSSYTQGKDPEEIRQILKDKYGFINYNLGILLTPYGEGYKDVRGGYVKSQILYNYFNNQYMNAIKLGIYQNDAETTRIAKEIFNMIFPGKAEEAYSITLDFVNSGEQDRTITFCGKDIQLTRSSSYSFGVGWQINL